jgi:hypothetical protein
VQLRNWEKERETPLAVFHVLKSGECFLQRETRDKTNLFSLSSKERKLLSKLTADGIATIAFSFLRFSHTRTRAARVRRRRRPWSQVTRKENAPHLSLLRLPFNFYTQNNAWFYQDRLGTNIIYYGKAAALKKRDVWYMRFLAVSAEADRALKTISEVKAALAQVMIWKE